MPLTIRTTPLFDTFAPALYSRNNRHYVETWENLGFPVPHGLFCADMNFLNRFHESAWGKATIKMPPVFQEAYEKARSIIHHSREAYVDYFVEVYRAIENGLVLTTRMETEEDLGGRLLEPSPRVDAILGSVECLGLVRSDTKEPWADLRQKLGDTTYIVNCFTDYADRNNSKKGIDDYLSWRSKIISAVNARIPTHYGDYVSDSASRMHPRGPYWEAFDNLVRRIDDELVIHVPPRLKT